MEARWQKENEIKKDDLFDFSNMKSTHENIIKFIKTVRESFADASLVYQYGCCYGFYKILNCVFGAESYMTDNHDHIVSKINGRFYDIEGEYITTDGNLRRSVLPMDKKLHDYWGSVGFGLRTEIMIQKQKNSFLK